MSRIQAICERSKHDVCTQYTYGEDQGMDKVPQAADRPDRGGAPNSRGGVESTDASSVFEDHAGAQESDTGYNIRNDLRLTPRRVSNHKCTHHECGGACGNERVGARARHALPPLSL